MGLVCSLRYVLTQKVHLYRAITHLSSLDFDVSIGT